ncbi:hypothetical protein [Clostridium merdae]|uniref:hypothetical protein n=1 Tax=Clostridium merdae TaxID=1958780 RepID=UPI000A2682A1|nr:hypothetical protein [Clostridium merdae]
MNFQKSNHEMPAGLRMALTENLEALNQFTAMPSAAQDSFIIGAKQVSSKQEMRSYVKNLTQAE